jgi:2-dehydro-3-deoxyglucarate aldolase/4-hydroxy-2-oxoheptanedioate aldolase
MANRLKQALTEGRLIRVFGMGQVCHPKLVEMIGLHQAWDAVWFDQEHAGLSTEQIENAARAARSAGLGSFVRLAATDYASVMRPLEAGAGGIMAAQVRSAAETEQIVTWAKFQPRGLRGVNGSGFDGQYGAIPMAEYLRQANNETFIAIQIENAEALAEVEKIAAVPDVDVLFIGPADLAQSLGVSAQWEHTRLWQAIERVAAACKAARKAWAILPMGVESARRCVKLGCTMLSLGFDVTAVHHGLEEVRTDFEEFFQTPSTR